MGLKTNIILLLMFASSASAQYSISKQCFTNGNIICSGEGYVLSGAAGLSAISNSGNDEFSLQSGFWTTAVEIIDDVENTNNILPIEFMLKQNYPNPFNPTTRIEFNLAKREFVKLSVYNILGEEVAHLINNELPAGRHSVTFDAAGLNSGIYFYKINAGMIHQIKKMILLK